jgi:hypothetical protein
MPILVRSQFEPGIQPSQALLMLADVNPASHSKTHSDFVNLKPSETSEPLSSKPAPWDLVGERSLSSQDPLLSRDPSRVNTVSQLSSFLNMLNSIYDHTLAIPTLQRIFLASRVATANNFVDSMPFRCALTRGLRFRFNTDSLSSSFYEMEPGH